MTTRSKSYRYYVKDTIVPFEEDACHEFKGHRNISAEEIPHWCVIPGTGRQSRKAVSRYSLHVLINLFICTKHDDLHLYVTDSDGRKHTKIRYNPGHTEDRQTGKRTEIKMDSNFQTNITYLFILLLLRMKHDHLRLLC
jgi:hypothetical protein